LSFSSQVKEELLKHHNNKQEEALAELAAILMFIGKINAVQKAGTEIILETDNESIWQKVFTLFKNLISILCCPIIVCNHNNQIWSFIHLYIHPPKTTKHLSVNKCLYSYTFYFILTHFPVYVNYYPSMP